jgi:peptidoglycan/xylan/chitin deacetylase (PgdA/CDA1 family)
MMPGKGAEPRFATVVMYHHVQPAMPGPLGRVNRLDLAAFREQLAYIRRHYTPVSVLNLLPGEREPLPPRPIVLSFDDGYRAHYREVAPVLADYAMPAVFFPVSSSMLERRVLDVNKIQCIVAVTDDVMPLVNAIDTAIDEERRRGRVLPSPAEYRAAWWKSSRWDAEPVVYVKRLLQHALPESLRQPLVDRLFREVVTNDEAGFAGELYMTADEARELQAAGMTIGAHGDRHVRLPTVPPEEQAREIDGALRVLDAVGASRHRFVYAYANGEHDAVTIDLLRARGCGIAFTTRPDLACLTADLLALPRLDTNDLPARADAPANHWTSLAAERSRG